MYENVIKKSVTDTSARRNFAAPAINIIKKGDASLNLTNSSYVNRIESSPTISNRSKLNLTRILKERSMSSTLFAQKSYVLIALQMGAGIALFNNLAIFVVITELELGRHSNSAKRLQITMNKLTLHSQILLNGCLMVKSWTPSTRQCAMHTL